MAFVVDSTVIDTTLGATASGVSVPANASSVQYRLDLPANTALKMSAAMRSGDTSLGDVEIDIAVTGPFVTDDSEPVPTDQSETTWYWQHNYTGTSTPGAEVWALDYPAVAYDRTIYVVIANYNVTTDTTVDLGFGDGLPARADVTFTQPVVDDLAQGGHNPPVAVAAVLTGVGNQMVALRSDGNLYASDATIARTTGARQLVSNVGNNQLFVVYADNTAAYMDASGAPRDALENLSPLQDVKYLLGQDHTSFGAGGISLRKDGGAGFFAPAGYSVIQQVQAYPYTDALAEYWYISSEAALIRTRSGIAGLIGTLAGSALDTRLRALGTVTQTWVNGNAYFVLGTDGVLHFDYDTGNAVNAAFDGTPATTTGVARIFPVALDSGSVALVVLKTDGTIVGYGTGYTDFAVPVEHNSAIAWFATTGEDSVLVKTNGSIVEYGLNAAVLPAVTDAFRASAHGDTLFVYSATGLAWRSATTDLTDTLPAAVRWPQALPASVFWTDLVGCREHV